MASANAGQAFSVFQSAQDKRIQKVVLGQTLTTDVDGKGSYAAAKVHDSVRADRSWPTSGCPRERSGAFCARCVR